jgi:hypothetical protein
MVWRLAHDDLDDGRKENERLVQRRKDHNVAGYWSDLLGGVDVPDPDLWNAVGRGLLAGVRTLLDSTEAELKTRWAVNEGRATATSRRSSSATRSCRRRWPSTPPRSA